MGTLAGQAAFYYLAAASIASAALAVTRSNPIHSMLWVLALFLHVAGIFVLVGAQFLAAVQVIVYAGAILVFYLFFVMLLDLPSETAARRFGAHWPLAAAAGAVFAFLLVRWYQPGLATPTPAATVDAAPMPHVAAVGMLLFTEFALPFEVMSLVLLVAILGAVVVARRKTES
jgi:NADH-quinone oxidoreductase subunit J